MSRARGEKAQKKKIRSTTASKEQTLPVKPIKSRQKPRYLEISPKSPNQINLVAHLTDPAQHIVIAAGPAGTGKTFLSMQVAIKALYSNQCDRIVLTRPVVGVEDEEHGFLPGDLNEKMDPWVRPLTDILRETYSQIEIEKLIEDRKIEIAPLAFCRGRTFKNAFLLADEMQNATPNQIKMLLTRIGKDSKFVLTGDVDQADTKTSNNGLLDLLNRLSNHSVAGISICELTAVDIQRHHIISDILRLYR